MWKMFVIWPYVLHEGTAKEKAFQIKLQFEFKQMRKVEKIYMTAMFTKCKMNVIVEASMYVEL